MNSRDRVLAAINHHRPDRVPAGFAGANSVIEKKLKKHFNLADDDYDGLLNALGIDTRFIFGMQSLPYTGPQLHKPIEGKCVDPFWGFITKWVDNDAGGYWDYCDFPLKDADIEAIRDWPMANPDHFDYSNIESLCTKYENYCIVYGHPGTCDCINGAGMVRTMENVLTDMALDNEITLMYMQRKTSTELAVMERVLAAAKRKIDIVWIGDDLGTQKSPMISLDMYRRILKPLHQKFIDLAKSYGAKTMIHSCGSSSWIFDEWAQMGMSIVDTLQPEAKDMSPAHLKKHFGDKLCFHGCISTAGPLAYGTIEDIEIYSKNTIEIMKAGGGYIFAPTHMIQDNTPVENVIAAYEACRKYGSYK